MSRFVDWNSENFPFDCNLPQSNSFKFVYITRWSFPTVREVKQSRSAITLHYITLSDCYRIIAKSLRSSVKSYRFESNGGKHFFFSSRRSTNGGGLWKIYFKKIRKRDESSHPHWKLVDWWSHLIGQVVLLEIFWDKISFDTCRQLSSWFVQNFLNILGKFSRNFLLWLLFWNLPHLLLSTYFKFMTPRMSHDSQFRSGLSSITCPDSLRLLHSFIHCTAESEIFYSAFVTFFSIHEIPISTFHMQSSW